jgi:hypothetical protein
MQRARLKTLIVSLMAVTLLVATSQYLSHFHVPRFDVTADVSAAHDGPAAEHSAQEHCSLCLQFDRLPAAPAPAQSPVAYFFHVVTVETARLERLALDLPSLWPPSRGPPSLAC